MANHKDPKARQFNIKTSVGMAVADVINMAGHRQVNVYHSPNNGAALFAVFPSSHSDEEMRAALLPVLEGDSLAPNQNITGLVSGCIMAETMPTPDIESITVGGNGAEFGIPTVRHAE